MAENFHQRSLSVLDEIYRVNGSEPKLPAVRRAKVRWRLPNMQRLVAPLTVGIGAIAVLVAAGQLWVNIHGPVGILGQPSLQLADFSGGDLSAALGGAVLDTDRDGTPDVEEKNLGTSAYLEDTDSDGITDSDEVKAGSDPTCPAGQNCGNPADAASAVTGATPAPGSPGMGVLPGLENGVPDASAAAGINGPLPAMDGAQLRQQMISSGVSAELLAGFSDAQLLEAYQEVAREQQAANPSAISPTPPAVPQPGQPAAAPNLAPEKFRQELLKQGVPEEMLSQYTDEQLLQLMNEVRADLSNE